MGMTASNKRAIALSLAGIAPLTYFIDTAEAATTYLGDQVNYGYGIVQVQITVDSANKIIQIDTPQVSTRGANASYTSYALPTLTKEALAAQSAKIQGVSGASYLSQGWISSLASAIAKISTTTSPVAPAPSNSAPATAPSAKPAPTTRPTPLPSQPAQGFQGGGDDGGYGEEGFRPQSKEREGGEGEEHHRRRPVAPITPKSPAPIVKSPAAPSSSPSPAGSPAGSPAAPSGSSDLGLGLTPGAGVIQKSITCTKGALKKTIKGVNPKCPTGYSLKKP